MHDGTTLVISPLISLMNDQVSALSARGIPATYIASTLDQSEQRERLMRMARGNTGWSTRLRSGCHYQAFAGRWKARLFPDSRG